MVLFVLCFAGMWLFEHGIHAGSPPSDSGKRFDAFIESRYQQNLLRDLNLDPAQISPEMVVQKDQTSYTVKSTLDPDLQKYIRRLLSRSQTRKAAVVLLNSHDGRILAMETWDNTGEKKELCLKACYPAASLFKIVSAAGAMESSGYRPEKNVYYRGKRHTLYKSQLKKKITRYTEKTTFKKAFAKSINPVFGKLGIFDLGSKGLVTYADRFLFNHVIPFDLPLDVSTVQVMADQFCLAEIASGFNKKTLISPLHAALLASVAVNKGVMVSPWLVESVKSVAGEDIYCHAPASLAMPVSPHTAKNLKVLMRDTVRSGTCRRSFYPLRRKKAFKNIELGAKTGTINDTTDQFKVDWLVAYAIPGKKEEGICIAVMGVHGKYLGIRANDLARYILDHYFSS